MDKHELTALSRTLSHALRHAPDEYGISLDAQGWVSLGDMVAALQRLPTFDGVDATDLREAIAAGGKRRHEIVGGRIRAVYGHSTGMPIEYSAAKPPDELFHGTTAAAAAVIAREGLRPMRRQYVHLSETPELARLVGARRTEIPIVLSVRAGDAARSGAEFFPTGDSVWLARSINPRWIEAHGAN